MVKYNGRTLLVSTGLDADPKHFDNEKYYDRTVPDAKVKNIRLSEWMSSVTKLLLFTEVKPVGKDAKFEAAIKAIINPSKQGRAHNVFLNVLDEFIAHKSPGTAKVYTDTRKKILSYDPDCTLEDMDYRWLMKFEEFCARTMRINAYAIHFRNIRAVFNYAIDMEYTNLYPFRKHKIKHEETRKRALTMEQMRTLLDYETNSYEEQKYIDIFMLQFYLLGINSVDLSELEDIASNGRVEYRRAKTHKLYSILVEPEAMMIIRKYRGKKHMIDITEKYASYKNFFHQQGKFLSKALGFTVSSYWSRHTWATLAASLDIPKETIAAALGHSSSSVTDIYIQFDQRKVDEANRRVIDYLLDTHK